MRPRGLTCAGIAPRVLVLGDAMLDRTIRGSAERTSPEAPVVVLRAGTVENRPGGAAAVAQLVAGFELGFDVQLAGVVGDDRDGAILRGTLKQLGVGTECLLVDPTRPTTVKERFVGQASGRHAQQLLRVDHESTEDLSNDVAESLWNRLNALILTADVVLISDYAKGVCTPDLLNRVIQACHLQEIPVVIDPARRTDIDRYRGADLIKPNRTWLELATGRTVGDLPAAQEAIEALRCSHGWRTEHLLVTLDRDGMLLQESGREFQHLPARIRPVYDVTGAGDMVQAVLGAAITQGRDWSDAARLAVAAAGLEVERPGVAPIPWRAIEAELSAVLTPAEKIVSRSDLRAQVDTARAHGRTIVFTNGCFDLLHAGHVRLLQQAAEFGDLLIVAINSDVSVRKIKGESRPIIPQEQRAEMLAALACVDFVIVFEDDTPIPLLEELQPDVLVKGGEYTREQVVGWEVVIADGGQVATVPMLPGMSTTRLVREMAEKMAVVAEQNKSDAECAVQRPIVREGFQFV